MAFSILAHYSRELFQESALLCTLNPRARLSVHLNNLDAYCFFDALRNSYLRSLLYHKLSPSWYLL